MAKVTKELADKIANSVKATVRGERLRDLCDTATGGDLDMFELDMLTDMVAVRLHRRIEQA